MMRNDSGTIPYPTIRFKEGDYVVTYLIIYNLFRKFKKNQITGKKIILIGIFLTVPLIGFAQNESSSFLNLWGESAKTAVGFFWKSGWAFILGYMISAMIQAFLPKKKLTKQMGKGNLKSISLSTLFGSISSSCSFAALAAARSLFLK